MLADETGTESAASMRQRAEELRDQARQARDLCAEMGALLDAPVETARREPPIWQGPCAERTTEYLAGRKRTLEEMAEALRADAGRWETFATDLEDRASQAGGMR